MALINIGSSANDGTGDPLRTAFSKINDRIAEFVSVSDYGAIGDGVADDTAAIAAAIAAADAIYFPAGTYNVTQIVVTGSGGVAASNKTLYGAGPGEVSIVGTSAGTSVIRFGTSASGSEADQGKRADYCNLRNINISATAAYTYGIECQWLTNARWDSVSVSGGANIETGMFIDFSWDNDFSHMTIAAENGIISGAYSPNRNSYHGLRLAGGSLGGVGFNFAGSGASLFGFDISAFTTGVKSSNGGYGLLLHGGYFESNTYDVSLGDGGINSASIVGCVFLDGTGADVGIQQSGAQSVNGVTVSGCAFRNKTDAIILTSSTNSWAITGNTYTSCTRSVTEAGARHVIDDGAGRLAVFSTLDISTAAAGQIKFPATQNPSSNANTLDDYEEGTFTPTANSITTVLGGGSVTYSGRYIKVGKLVFYSILVDSAGGATTASTAGISYFSGMPFNAASDATACGTLQAVNGGLASFGNGAVFHSGITRAYLPTWAATASDMYISGCYEAAA